MLCAAAAATVPAVGTEPVNDSRLMPGWAVRGAPAAMPVPCTTLKTPSGRPASAVMSARSDAVLILSPPSPTARNVRSILLAGEYGFF